ncbi:MAG: GDP-mannose 4,6-dehydratase [Phycisphaerae bacterium]
MRALITGGAGFIGSHLSEHLLRLGHEVTVVDNLSTGRMANIEHLMDHRGFRFVLDSVRNEQAMHLLVSQCDVVFHLAAAVGVQLIVNDPVRTIETNIHGSEVVLAIANKFGKKILLASTSEVYGKSEKVPFREDDDTVWGPTRFSRWSYACSKAIDEFLGLAYHQQYGLPVVIVRLFNTVGPRQVGQYGMVLPRFVNWALRNEPLCIYGDGRQTRCFCSVSDAVGALVELMLHPETGGEVFNVGSDEEISIEALADRVIELTASQSAKRFISYEQAYGRPFDDMRRRVPCLDKVRQFVGYKPQMDLTATIQSIIDYYKAQPK